MNVIKETARHFATSENEVRREMQKAIEMAFLSNDEKTQRNLKELFPDGKIPTPEEFIKKIKGQVR